MKKHTTQPKTTSSNKAVQNKTSISQQSSITTISSVRLWKKGTSETIQVTEQQQQQFLSILNELLLELVPLRVYVGDERVKSIKDEEISLELFLSNNSNLTNKMVRELEVQRLLLPISGDFGVNAKSKSAIILLGDKANNYFSPAYMNSKGYPALKQLLNNLNLADVLK